MLYLLFWGGSHEGSQMGVVHARLVVPLARHDKTGVLPEIPKGNHLVFAWKRRMFLSDRRETAENSDGVGLCGVVWCGVVHGVDVECPCEQPSSP